MTVAPGDSSPLRIGDAQRDAAVEALRAHFSEGRLSVGEFDERMGKALAAKTADDLRPLFADLPRDTEAVNGVSVWRAPVPAVRKPGTLALLQRWMIALAPVLWLLVFTGWNQWWLAYVLWGAVFVVINRFERLQEEAARPKELPPPVA